MGKANKIEQLKKAIVTSLYQSKGNVSIACTSVGIGRTQFYNWKKEDSEFALAVDNVTDFAIDHVENQLHNKIDEGDITAIIFYLKTIGRKRGYVEKQTMDTTIRLGKDLADETYL